eukprot:39945-Hanusia_phi.AAC.1
MGPSYRQDYSHSTSSIRRDVQGFILRNPARLSEASTSKEAKEDLPGLEASYSSSPDLGDSVP